MSVIFSSRGILKDGLILNLDAADTFSYFGSGTRWNDLSGNGTHGTLINSPTFSSGSFTFNGSTQYVDLGVKQLNTAAGTIGFWIKLTNTITTGYAGNQRPFGLDTNFEMRWGGTGNQQDRQLQFDLGGTSNLLTLKNEWLNTEWYNVVATWDSSLTRSAFYVNGVLDNTGTTGATATVTSYNATAYIARSVAGGYINGQIPYFITYNRELNASEVSRNYDVLKGRFGL